MSDLTDPAPSGSPSAPPDAKADAHKRQVWRQRKLTDVAAPSHEWKHIEIDGEYVPRIGSVPGFAPERNGAIYCVQPLGPLRPRPFIRTH